MVFNSLLVVLVGLGFMRQEHDVRRERGERKSRAEAGKVKYSLKFYLSPKRAYVALQSCFNFNKAVNVRCVSNFNNFLNRYGPWITGK
jgi:hypothetical protein